MSKKQWEETKKDTHASRKAVFNPLDFEQLQKKYCYRRWHPFVNG